MNGLFFEFVQAGPILPTEVKEICGRLHKPQINQLVDCFASNTLNVHGLSVDKMLQAALNLGGAPICVGAKVLGFPFSALQAGSAIGAMT